MPEIPVAVPAWSVRIGTQTLRWLCAVLYLLILGVIAALMPLRLAEVLQLTGSLTHTFGGLMKWVAFTPGAAPLNYILQWPFVAVARTPLLARALSTIFAAGSMLVCWSIAQRLRLRNWPLVVAVAATAPIAVVLGVTGQPGAQALFFSLLAALCFVQIIEKASVPRVSLYGLALTAAIYTQPLAYAPALGYLIFYFRFVARPEQRRTIWLLLPATFAPLLAFLPYYVWAAPRAAEHWLYSNEISRETSVQAWQAASAAGAGEAMQIALLFLGALVGVWASFLPLFPVRWSDGLLRKNVAVFCLFGGALGTAVAATALSLANIEAIQMTSLAPIVPLLTLVFAAGLEYFRFGKRKWSLLPVFASLLLVIGLVQDFLLTRESPPPDLQALANSAESQLTGDSCVVFVSENLSRPLLVTLRPELGRNECLNFFHRRIVLAVHPYVRPTQLEDAETFFRGLDFVEAERVLIGGGEVIVLEQKPTRG